MPVKLSNIEVIKGSLSKVVPKRVRLYALWGPPLWADLCSQ